jgi:hypothetical protein
MVDETMAASPNSRHPDPSREMRGRADVAVARENQNTSPAHSRISVRPLRRDQRDATSAPICRGGRRRLAAVTRIRRISLGVAS